MDVRQIQTYARYSAHKDWTMYDTIHSIVRKERLVYEYYEWRKRIRRVIIDIKFGPPGLRRFEIERFRKCYGSTW